MSSRTLVMGDLHGAHRALLQVLERSAFDRQRDRLIFLGDVADGWPDTPACIDELLSIENLIHLIGNHDEWLQDWVEGEGPTMQWLMQGGRATLLAYGGLRENVPASHRRYLRTAKCWHEEAGRVFVHGGWPWYQCDHPMAFDAVTWDRELWSNAVARELAGQSAPLTRFREVFVGHTTTTRQGFTEPARCCEVWNLDQGAGWEGKLSIMDVETKEFWQSDVVSELYPEHAGRRRVG